MKPRATLLFSLDQNHYHGSLIHAGLDLLSRRGLLDVTYHHTRGADKVLTRDPLTMCLLVQPTRASSPRLLAIDLHDQSDVLAREVLEQCDQYLKRNLYRPDLASLPASLTAKIRPFGLNYPCQTRGACLRMSRTSGWRFATAGLPGLRRLYHFWALPNVRDFEQSTEKPLEPTVVFQTRIWGAHETGAEESAAFNQERVDLVRALKEAFGERFRGGLVPTPLALREFPQDVSPFPSRPRPYLAMSKRNEIAIYTRGLHGSTAFKLPEYLAASQCIIAEPPRNELPSPLEPGRHFLPFHDIEECVATCRKLLSDTAAVAAMRRANHEYYRTEVEPAARFARIIETCATPAM